jgi:hypothetical protein
LKAWPVLAIVVIQALLFLAHWFIYSTFIAFCPGLSPAAAADLRVVLFTLAFSFAPFTLLAFRFSSLVVRLLYNIAATWLGFLNFFFWAAIFVRLAWLALRLSHSPANPAGARLLLLGVFFSLAALAGIYGLINAHIIRVRRVAIHLPNLPASWHNRRGVLLSDLHLGAINGVRFCRRMVTLAARFRPDVVFIPGDLFDGTMGDINELVAPFKTLAAPLGIYFSTGNHEEFHSTAQYLEAIRRAGIRVLANEQVCIDGLQIAGVFYHDSTYPIRMKAILEGLHPDGAQPAILLNHAPTRLPIVEQAGYSLQLSGHTHGGQILPFTWLTQRVFGPFTSGLHRFSSLQVYTSTGAGTWGPPMRVGTSPEIVVIEFK